MKLIRGVVVSMLIAGCALGQADADKIGLFEGHTEVGPAPRAGSVKYSSGEYTISGGGENMWATKDEFHFVWKKMSGDVSVAADIAMLEKEGDPHRKGVLMIRQSLDADSAYVDAARHGDGLTSLQFRDEKGVTTHEVQSNVSGPSRLRLVKRGRDFYLWVAGADGKMQFSGGSVSVAFQEPFYVGIGVCAHNKDAIQSAAFSHVELGKPEAGGGMYSTVETITVRSTDARANYVQNARVEAPVWSHDGLSLLFNSDGRIERVPVTGGQAQVVDTGSAIRANSDHGISPDGSLLAFSDETGGGSAVYVVPVNGGNPKRITGKDSAYFHGWSPDGKMIVYSGVRGGKFDAYTVPVEGGESVRLTSGNGKNDGPEFSPDGAYIYFSSDRKGGQQIWRMRADGSEQEQMTSGDGNYAYPHVSPDGSAVAFLSEAGAGEAVLQVMTVADKKVRVLAKFKGGKGSFDSPAWSPDSRRLAFVSYQRM